MPRLRSGCQAEARGMLALCLARTFPWHPEPVCPSWHGRVHVSCAYLPRLFLVYIHVSSFLYVFPVQIIRSRGCTICPLFIQPIPSYLFSVPIYFLPPCSSLPLFLHLLVSWILFYCVQKKTVLCGLYIHFYMVFERWTGTWWLKSRWKYVLLISFYVAQVDEFYINLFCFIIFLLLELSVFVSKEDSEIVQGIWWILWNLRRSIFKSLSFLWLFARL